MNLLLIEPFFTGSHRAWAEGYAANSRHQVEVLSLPGRHWKWRMVGGAVALARLLKAREALPEALLVSDMVDLSALRGLLPPRWRAIPTALYFHENQITYPWSPRDPDRQLKRDRHYGYINFRSALSADWIFFNSDFHRTNFLEALPEFLRPFPDQRNTGLVDELVAKSECLHLGLDLRALDAGRVEKEQDTQPLVLWNHRWEYDKDPETFFRVLFELDDAGVPFSLAVLGDAYRESPPIFAEAQRRLAGRIVQWGFADSREAYQRWLWRADVLPVTSRQDFFGASAIEAMYCGTYALLPNRLAFPEHIPDELNARFLYEEGDLKARLQALLGNRDELRQGGRQCRELARRYDWTNLAARYDAAMNTLKDNLCQ